MPFALEVAIAVVLVTGTFLMVVTGIGLVRFPDTYCRMHAAGKAGTLGVALLVVAPVLFFAGADPETVTGAGFGAVLFRAVLAIVFQFVTTPAATHLLARACYLRDYPLFERTALDELQGVLSYTSEDAYGGEE